jgi:small subunit ribosomal protein S20
VANIKSAEKRAKQAVKRRAHNMAARSRLRTSIKKVLNAVGAGKKDEAAEALKAAQPVIDTMTGRRGPEGRAAGHRHHGQQGHHSPQQGRAPQARAECQGEGAGCQVSRVSRLAKKPA